VALCSDPQRFERNGARRTVHAGPVVDLAATVNGEDKAKLATMLYSAAMNTQRRIRAWLMCRGFSSDDLEEMVAGLPEIEFHALPMDSIRHVSRLHLDENPSRLDRLLLPSMLNKLDRVLLVDADSLILGDLAELHGLNANGRAVTAKTLGSARKSGLDLLERDAARLSKTLARDLRRQLCSGAPLNSAVIDTGVMVLDLARMRRDFFSETWLGYVQRFGIGHAHIYNYYARADVARLPDEWNARPEFEPVELPRLLHWPGSLKPWSTYHGPERETWQNYHLEGERRLLRGRPRRAIRTLR
jgi:lipopolysaccharide biosynthesis glycosyltransferase